MYWLIRFFNNDTLVVGNNPEELNELVEMGIPFRFEDCYNSSIIAQNESLVKRKSR